MENSRNKPFKCFKSHTILRNMMESYTALFWPLWNMSYPLSSFYTVYATLLWVSWWPPGSSAPLLQYHNVWVQLTFILVSSGLRAWEQGHWQNTLVRAGKTKKTIQMLVWGDGSVIKCLSCKQENLSSDPPAPSSELGTAAYIDNSSVRRSWDRDPEAYLWF